MQERDYASFEEKTLSFEDNVILALSRVQGHWNKKSKKLLTSQLSGTESLDLKDSSPPERAIIGLVTNALTTLVGDGSIASVIFSRSVPLPDKDRGLIILLASVGESRINKTSDWKRLALFAADNSRGNSFEKTYSKFRRKMKGLSGVFSLAFKKFDTKTGDMDAPNTEEDIEEAFKHLEKLYGGSDETLLSNKIKLEKEITDGIGVELTQMNSRELSLLYSDLSLNFDSDPVLTSSFAAARNLMQEILSTKISGLANILGQIRSGEAT